MAAESSWFKNMVGGAWHWLVSIGFRLLYNELAWSYDVVSWLVSRGHWREWQRSALPFLHGQRVLELAHGPGHMLLALEEAGFDVVGLDLSWSMGRLAARRIRKVGSSAVLVRGRAQTLPFAFSSFDSVLATFPTEFLAQMATIEAVFAVLRPGGRLVIVPQARLTGASLVTRFLEWLYAITGQRPADHAGQRYAYWMVMQDRFQTAGFELSLETLQLESSEVTIVLAEKPPAVNITPEVGGELDHHSRSS